MVDAVGAGSDEGDSRRLVDSVAGGDAAALEAELARLRAEGQEGITLIRAMLRRMALLARLRAEVEQRQQRRCRHGVTGKSLFWKEKDAVGAQLGAVAGGTARQGDVGRLLEAERQVKASGGVGPLAADEELFAICRQAARLSTASSRRWPDPTEVTACRGDRRARTGSAFILPSGEPTVPSELLPAQALADHVELVEASNSRA